MFVEMFLSYMNNLLYSTYDITKMIEELKKKDPSGVDDDKIYTLTGITPLEAYE